MVETNWVYITHIFIELRVLTKHTTLCILNDNSRIIFYNYIVVPSYFSTLHYFLYFNSMTTDIISYFNHVLFLCIFWNLMKKPKSSAREWTVVMNLAPRWTRLLSTRHSCTDFFTKKHYLSAKICFMQSMWVAMIHPGILSNLEVYWGFSFR